MKFTQTSLPDVVILESEVFGDDRGWFMESFNDERFRQGLKALGLDAPSAFVQDNHSLSAKGVLRGLHYQCAPRAQGKLVRVIAGEAFDVAVDIRPNSPTYGKWTAVHLSAKNRKMLWIPAGFAHGFLAMTDGTEFLYKTTDYYDKASERALRWNDKDIGIVWPLFGDVVVSKKDLAAQSLAEMKGECK